MEDAFEFDLGPLSITCGRRCFQELARISILLLLFELNYLPRLAGFLSNLSQICPKSLSSSWNQTNVCSANPKRDGKCIRIMLSFFRSVMRKSEEGYAMPLGSSPYQETLTLLVETRNSCSRSLKPMELEWNTKHASPPPHSETVSCNCGTTAPRL